MLVLPLLMKSASQPTLSNQERECQQEVVLSAEGTHVTCHVFHVTKPTIKNIFSYLIKYQALILCLP